MAFEAYASANPNQVHSDVLLKARESCYKARDAFYACVEKESHRKPTEIGSVGLLYPKECRSSRTEFVKQCRSSWVKHFDRQYCRNKRVQRLLDDGDSRKEAAGGGVGLYRLEGEEGPSAAEAEAKRELGEEMAAAREMGIRQRPFP